MAAGAPAVEVSDPALLEAPSLLLAAVDEPVSELVVFAVDSTVVVATTLLEPVVESVAVPDEEPVRVVLSLSVAVPVAAEPVAVEVAVAEPEPEPDALSEIEDSAPLIQLWTSDGRLEIHSVLVAYSLYIEGRAPVGSARSSDCTEVGRAEKSSP